MSSIPSWAVRGKRVVCIDDSSRVGERLYAPADIVRGEVYTISGIVDGTYLALMERPNPYHGYGPEIGWRIERFRPLVEDSNEDGIEARLYRNKGLRSKQPERAREEAGG